MSVANILVLASFDILYEACDLAYMMLDIHHMVGLLLPTCMLVVHLIMYILSIFTKVVQIFLSNNGPSHFILPRSRIVSI